MSELEFSNESDREGAGEEPQQNCTDKPPKAQELITTLPHKSHKEAKESAN